MRKHAHARVVAACLGLFAFDAAQAALSTLSPAPENDPLDTAAGLAWIETASSQDGLGPGYRLAAAGEARGLSYVAMSLSDGVFAMGADRGRSKADDYCSFADSGAIGHAAGVDEQIDLTGREAQPTSPSTVPGMLNSKGTAGTACLAHGCVPGLTPWGVFLTDQPDADTGFFVDKAVRTTVPEPINARFWALGLLTLGTLAVGRRP